MCAKDEYFQYSILDGYISGTGWVIGSGAGMTGKGGKEVVPFPVPKPYFPPTTDGGGTKKVEKVR